MSDETLSKIKKLLKSDKLVFGTERAYKELQSAKAAEIVVASNVPADMEKDLLKYGAMTDIKITKVDMPNDALGTFCKKPFPVLAITILK